jgi:hypothetical protein
VSQHDDDAGSIESGVVVITGGRGDRGENKSVFFLPYLPFIL